MSNLVFTCLHLLQDTSKSVKMMKQTNHLKFASLEAVQAKILEIPYKGKALSMVVLLPDEVDGLQKVKLALNFFFLLSKKRIAFKLPRKKKL